MMRTPPFGPIPAPPPEHQPSTDTNPHRIPALLATLTLLKRTYTIEAATLDTIKREIVRVETALHIAMSDAGARMYASNDAVVEIKPRTEYRVTSWEDLRAHINATGEWDLVHKRISSTAMRERGEALPPGVMEATFDTLVFSPR
jgi:hypothetical protein